jgi:hypothetical protein
MLITTIPAVLCLLLMRRPKAEGRPRVAPEHAVMD